MDDAWIDENDVSDRLSKLEPEKAPGMDGVNSFVLKQCHSAMARPLAMIFKLSLNSGRLPSKWKMANVTPLHKKGNRSEASNYRPVSLTSVICKVLERILRDVIMVHLVSNGLLSESQHGFVPKKSCTTNLLETLDFLTDCLARKIPVDIIFLDFAKAFDKVPHRRLLLKLKAYGIGGGLLNWITDFLSERTQRVVLGDSVSGWAPVHSGVPQGSVLGPILFLLYINDLPECVHHSICKLYADDSKILAKIRNETDVANLQEDLNRIVEWTDTWLMRLNYDKCKIMHYGKKNTKKGYTMHDSKNNVSYDLSKTDAERDLGVIVSADGKWHKHVSSICSKANGILGWMKGAFVSRDIHLWKKLYTTQRTHDLNLSLLSQSGTRFLNVISNSWNRSSAEPLRYPMHFETRATLTDFPT